MTELDTLMSDDFLNSLDVKSKDDKHHQQVSQPSWIKNEDHTTHRVWKAILKLKVTKELQIANFGKVADGKTPKSLYRMKKSEVALAVGVSAQSIFRSSTFSKDVLQFFDMVNKELLERYQREQKKQKSRLIATGVRTKKKDDLVLEVQDLRNKVRELECRQVKDTLDLVLSKMPIDLRRKLRM
ncbi:hypothetical protein VIN01S_19560 [Vibrio inusitatus NBRC 102082]|uniref:Uncharacterized protein n=1 Tax=Vibrio inusitatus NBRC 102082 TaxID=1219070 RepID=A0A4Y3HWT2_9VIBR|nr:hypothetical protein [Vibrio inusitatus]GEA51152.1 hypothetical protein VIN01S_19560 [Vibrio inusitatus NBRC 102082]